MTKKELEFERVMKKKMISTPNSAFMIRDWKFFKKKAINRARMAMPTIAKAVRCPDALITLITMFCRILSRYRFSVWNLEVEESLLQF